MQTIQGEQQAFRKEIIMNSEKLTKPLKANQKLTIEDIDGPYAENQALRSHILKRGI